MKKYFPGILTLVITQFFVNATKCVIQILVLNNKKKTVHQVFFLSSHWTRSILENFKTIKNVIETKEKIQLQDKRRDRGRKYQEKNFSFESFMHQALLSFIMIKNMQISSLNAKTRSRKNNAHDLMQRHWYEMMRFSQWNSRKEQKLQRGIKD